MTCIHGLVWLEKSDGVLSPVANEEHDTIATVDELGEGAYELHWFSNVGQAKAFKLGIELIGTNIVAVTLGKGDVANCALVHRMDRQAVKTTRLDDAIVLVAHDETRHRKAKVIWGKETRAIEQTGPNSYSSIRAAYIGEVGEEKVEFRFWYERWKTHPQYEDIKYSGVHGFALVKDDGGKWLETSLPEENPFSLMGPTRAAPWMKKLAVTTAEYGGVLEGMKFRFPIRQDLTEMLTRIAPLFHEIAKIERDALESERKRKFFERTDVQKCIVALADNGAIDANNDAYVLSSGSKHWKISKKLVEELLQNNAIKQSKVSKGFELAKGIEPLEENPLDVSLEDVFKL